MTFKLLLMCINQKKKTYPNADATVQRPTRRRALAPLPAYSRGSLYKIFSADLAATVADPRTAHDEHARKSGVVVVGATDSGGLF